MRTGTILFISNQQNCSALSITYPGFFILTMFSPKHILVSDLSYPAKIFIFYIAFCSNSKNGLKMSLNEISKNLKTSKSSIIDCVKELEARELICVYKSTKKDKSRDINIYQIK
jgi:hypothetical protein